jgi:hypothetical protein
MYSKPGTHGLSKAIPQAEKISGSARHAVRFFPTYPLVAPPEPVHKRTVKNRKFSGSLKPMIKNRPW